MHWTKEFLYLIGDRMLFLTIPVDFPEGVSLWKGEPSFLRY